METQARTLVISDGGVGSVVACAAAREAVFAAASAGASKASQDRHGARDAGASAGGVTASAAQRPLVFVGHLPAHSAAARRRAIERQCAALDLELVESLPSDAVPDDAPAGERATRVLIGAAFGAARRGAGSVVWPVHFFNGSDVDLDGVADAIDRALLVTRLMGVDAQPGVRVEVPYADFTDRQLVELAVDLGTPLGTCWWWHAQLGTPEGGREDEFRAEHRRWAGLLSECGWVREAGAD